MLEAVMCLALNIYFEARDQNIDGQLMVAEVTMNRVKDSHFPDNVCDVVWQPGAFSWTDDGKSDKPKDLKAFATSVLLANEVLKGTAPVLGTDAVFYHEKSIRPYWVDTVVEVGQVGDHIFYEQPTKVAYAITERSFSNVR